MNPFSPLSFFALRAVGYGGLDLNKTLSQNCVFEQVTNLSS